MLTLDQLNQLDHWFAHHPPQNQDQIRAYESIRKAGKAFAEIVMEYTPPSADQSAAVRKIREAVMTANAALACEGR